MPYLRRGKGINIEAPARQNNSRFGILVLYHYREGLVDYFQVNTAIERWRYEEIHSRLEIGRAEEQELQDCAFCMGLGMSIVHVD
jgi:hypothetical protein